MTQKDSTSFERFFFEKTGPCIASSTQFENGAVIGLRRFL